MVSSCCYEAMNLKCWVKEDTERFGGNAEVFKSVEGVWSTLDIPEQKVGRVDVVELFV